MQEREREREKEEERKREELKQKLASHVDHGGVTSARQRYLNRQKQPESSDSE
jgi:hypothetical protein